MTFLSSVSYSGLTQSHPAQALCAGVPWGSYHHSQGARRGLSSSPAPGLGETSIPPLPRPSPPHNAQALWKKGWVSRVFRGFKIGEEKKKINAKFLWLEDTACWQKPLFTDSSRLKSETLKSGYCGYAVFFFSKQSGTQFCTPVPGPNPAFLSRSDSHWL